MRPWGRGVGKVFMQSPRASDMLPAAPVFGRDWGHPANPGAILAVQTQRIGDVICFTPMLTALRRRFPEARLTALVQPPAHELLAGNPDLDRVIVYDPAVVRRRPARLLEMADT